MFNTAERKSVRFSHWAWKVALGGALVIIFLLARVGQVSDSGFSLVLSERLLTQGTFSLDVRTVCPESSGKVPCDDIRIVEVDQRLYYFFPNGSSLLSLPFVALAHALGVTLTNPATGAYNFPAEYWLQRLIAALLIAVWALVALNIAQSRLPPSWSVVLVLGLVFGSQTFSTASRGLWSHTWGIFLLTLALLMIVRARNSDQASNPYILATLLAWLYFVRPTFSVSIAALALYAILTRAVKVWPLVVTGLLWLLAFVFHSEILYGTALPPYYSSNRLVLDGFLERLLGQLISPHRGTLLYLPGLVFVVVLGSVYFRYISERLLWAFGLGAIVFHVVAVSLFPHWWGGWAYGPRLTTDIVPWYLLLAVLSLEAFRRATSEYRRPVYYVILGVGLFWVFLGVLLHAPGALCWEAMSLGLTFDAVAANPQLLWDWSNPQFLRCRF